MKKNLYDMNMKVKTLRLKDSVANIIDFVAREKNMTTSEYIRSLIEKDIKDFKTKKAIGAYKRREVNLSEGAKMAGVSYREFMTILENNGISLNLDGFPIDYGIKSIEKSLKKR